MNSFCCVLFEIDALYLYIVGFWVLNNRDNFVISYPTPLLYFMCSSAIAITVGMKLSIKKNALEKLSSRNLQFSSLHNDCILYLEVNFNHVGNMLHV